MLLKVFNFKSAILSASRFTRAPLNVSLKNRPPSLFFLKAEARRAPLIGRVLHRGQSQAVNGFQGTASAGAKAPLTRAAASVTEKGRLNLTLIFLAVILRNLLFTTLFFFPSNLFVCIYFKRCQRRNSSAPWKAASLE